MYLLSIFDRAINGIVNALLGKRHYQVRMTYKSANTKIFEFVRIVEVSESRQIGDRRLLKRVFGNIAHQFPSNKKYLCNGELDIEVDCYLGRWR